MFHMQAQNAVQSQWKQTSQPASASMLDKPQGFVEGERLLSVTMLMQVHGVSLQVLCSSLYIFRLSATKTVEEERFLCYDAHGSLLIYTRNIGTCFWSYVFQVGWCRLCMPISCLFKPNSSNCELLCNCQLRKIILGVFQFFFQFQYSVMLCAVALTHHN